MPEAIAALDVFPLREPVSGRRYTVIRLRTGSGAAGYGECRAATARQLDQARRALAGKPATAYELVRRELAASSLRAAVDMALLDIAGKLAKAPAYQLLGGPTRFKIRAMARLEGATGAELRASLDRARQSGFRAPHANASTSSARPPATASISCSTPQPRCRPATPPQLPPSWSVSTCSGSMSPAACRTWRPSAKSPASA
jgi:hypothetical protein